EAEDGIRDDLVAGVQTCALPISGATSRPARRAWTMARLSTGPSRSRSSWVAYGRPSQGGRWPRRHVVSTRMREAATLVASTDRRSEERRVGKERRRRARRRDDDE